MLDAVSSLFWVAKTANDGKHVLTRRIFYIVVQECRDETTIIDKKNGMCWKIFELKFLISTPQIRSQTSYHINRKIFLHIC